MAYRCRSFALGKRRIGLCLLSLLFLSTLAAEPTRLPRKGPFFPVDERIVEDRWHLERFVVRLQRHAANPVIVREHPWETNGAYAGQTLKDPKTGAFLMWYGVFDEYAYNNRLPFSYNICFATSRDGVAWTKPHLGVFDFRGSKANNIIRLGRTKTQQIDVALKPQNSDLPGEFVAIHNDKGGVFVSTSSDGRAFDFLQEKAAVTYHSDTTNNFVYDEMDDRWLMYVRPQAYAGSGLPHVGRRRVAVKESGDLRRWTPERTVLVPEENDPDYFYGMSVFRRGDLFFGLLELYETVHHHIDMELTWSADGYHWERIPVRTLGRLLEHGAEGAWDAGMVVATGDPLEIGEELWFYYGATDTAHDQIGTAGVGIATTKRDRLVGVRGAKGAHGRLLTRPFEVKGGLRLNARARGTIRVSVHTTSDSPMDGWSAADCDAISGDHLDAAVLWGKKGLNQLRGQAVRLRFHLDDAELFAFDFER